VEQVFEYVLDCQSAHQCYQVRI